MQSHASTLIIIAFVFILSVNHVCTNNFDDDGNEITIRHFLPQFRHISASEELTMRHRLDEHIRTTNLSMLLKLIQWTSGLQEELKELKTNVTQRGVRHFHGLPLLGPTKDIEDFVDETVNFLKSYERKMEDELRKPTKEWNYPEQDS